MIFIFNFSSTEAESETLDLVKFDSFSLSVDGGKVDHFDFLTTITTQKSS